MLPHRLAAPVVVAILAAVIVIPAASGKTSHAGWPKINGKFRKDSHDRGKTYVGSSKSDELLGGHGNNTLYGKGASDVLWGDYKPSGWPAHQSDRMFGGDGNDFIYASHTFNHIEGGNGDDTIHAHFGSGSIDCGPGNDIVFLSHRSRPHYKLTGCERISFKSDGK
jgi:Ca2+-binding RTX toxin-like protein